MFELVVGYFGIVVIEDYVVGVGGVLVDGGYEI